jgi:hypothetical protein
VRLARIGPPGAETPGVVLADGTVLDASQVVRDFDVGFFARADGE